MEVITGNQEVKMQEKLGLVPEAKPIDASMLIFGNMSDFESGQRMAVALSKSTIVPREYQNNPSNTLIALEISMRLKTSPMMVMQNLYVVNGRPSWSSQFIIATINSSRRFAKPLQFKVEGSDKDLSCYCYTIDFEGNEIKGPVIDMKMAQGEGWLSKTGSKWQTMPEIMIRYRAASFFGRLYCSDILMGIYTTEENTEFVEAEFTPEDEIKTKANRKELDIKEDPQVPYVDHKVVEVVAAGLEVEVKGSYVDYKEPYVDHKVTNVDHKVPYVNHKVTKEEHKVLHAEQDVFNADTKVTSKEPIVNHEESVRFEMMQESIIDGPNF